MIDVIDEGKRPVRILDASQKTAEAEADALLVCPGIGLEHIHNPDDSSLVDSLRPGWGPINSIYEGYASDDALRFAASSGGASSAIALCAIESHGFEGVLHIAENKKRPYVNETVFSRTRAELHSRTGSRYSPASPCESLNRIEAAAAQCVFIGKPCDVAAAQKARRLRPKLDANLGLTIAFFCAGTPSTNGTLAMLEQMGVLDVGELESVRYRGNGWPGLATAIVRNSDGALAQRSMSYAESWGDILSRHVQWRCRLCVDHTGEFADLAVGDPWYREIEDGELGSSLILARTDLGRAFLRSAINRGYLVAEVASASILPRSQENLLRTRGSVWGRTLGCKLVGAPVPRNVRLPTFRFWMSELTLVEKFKSIFGTSRRALQRRLHKRKFQNSRSSLGS